jgi:hypothetical protein
MKESDLTPELFVAHDSEGEVGSFVKMALFQPSEMLRPNHGFQSKLGVSYATSFYTVHEMLEIIPNEGDKVHERLESQACVGANGFLEQVNIVSVINKLNSSLPVTVSYYDASGQMQGTVQSVVAGNLKSDFIINDMGLELDTYGTVCVDVDGPVGSWSGGIALYKPDQRSGAGVFGDGFDFALYYPFSNPKVGVTTVPLNTFHLGTDARDTVANWIAVSDAVTDGARLKGALKVYGATGSLVYEERVVIPDGGRIDFAGHLSLTGGLNIDAVGMAEFVPDNVEQDYYLTVTRYFYDCQGVACNDFLTAFAVPDRPGTSSEIAGGITTADGLISVVELNNTEVGSSTVDVEIRNASGATMGNPQSDVPEKGTRHIIVNANGNVGFLAADNDGLSTVEAEKGSVSALHMMYRLDDTGQLEEAFAAPLVASPGISQVSQFNTFIEHQNTTEVCNVTPESRSVTVRYVDVTGVEVHQEDLVLKPWESKRFVVPVLPINTFGSVLIDADAEGVVLRNYVSRPGQYTMVFGAE